MSKTPVRTGPERMPQDSVIRDYVAKLRARADGCAQTVEEARRYIDRHPSGASLTEELYKIRNVKDR